MLIPGKSPFSAPQTQNMERNQVSINKDNPFEKYYERPSFLSKGSDLTPKSPPTDNNRNTFSSGSIPAKTVPAYKPPYEPASSPSSQY